MDVERTSLRTGDASPDLATHSAFERFPNAVGSTFQRMPGRRQLTHLDQVQSHVGSFLQRITLLCSSSAGRHLKRIRVTLLARDDQILPKALRERIAPLLLRKLPRSRSASVNATRITEQCAPHKNFGGDFITEALDLIKLTKIRTIQVDESHGHRSVRPELCQAPARLPLRDAPPYHQ